jgi:methylmalonyl-CoA mutase N-terminal domain/subunit
MALPVVASVVVPTSRRSSAARRGARATMYAGRPWTIRQYAGFSGARLSAAPG